MNPLGLIIGFERDKRDESYEIVLLFILIPRQFLLLIHLKALKLSAWRFYLNAVVCIFKPFGSNVIVMCMNHLHKLTPGWFS